MLSYFHNSIYGTINCALGLDRKPTRCTVMAGRINELAVRFHHLLVAIHPFPNGNGRHARLMADLLVTRLGGTVFTWGSRDTASVGDVRRRYVAALRLAGVHDAAALIEFARS